MVRKMKNSKYWEGRVANKTWDIYNSTLEKNKALLEMYQEAYLDLSEELYRVTEKINGGKPTLTDMHKLNRLSKLQENFEKIIKELVENVELNSKQVMFNAFKDNYKNIMSSLGKEEFAEVNKSLMEELLEKPWHGGYFSERLWKNTSILANNLNELLTQGLIQGKTIAEISIGLSNLMQQGFNVTHRLVRTETMHYLNQSSHRAYKDAGCEKVQIWAAKDERTCSICGKQHGKIYSIDKAPTLGFHPNCRCTYLPVIEVEKSNAKESVKEWQDIKHDPKVYKNKKEISNKLQKEYNIKLSDSRKYPIDKEILSNCINWMDKFYTYFEGFKDIDPVELPSIKIKGDMKNSVGSYRYYLNKPEAVELNLNGLYFNDKEYNIEYIERCIESGWTVPNAKGHKTFVHEYGHHIANSLKWLDAGNNKPNYNWCKDFINKVIDNYNKQYNKNIIFDDLDKLLSTYGSSKEEEAFAEAFAEYFGGENPRDFAKVFGKMIEEELKKYIKKRRDD